MSKRTGRHYKWGLGGKGFLLSGSLSQALAGRAIAPISITHTSQGRSAGAVSGGLRRVCRGSKHTPWKYMAPV